jgi:hypothetical protein
MLYMFLHLAAVDDNVSQIHEEEIEASHDAVHHPLEGVAGIPQSKGHAKKFKKTKRLRP